MTDPLEKPDGLNWDPAAVELPEVPLLPPGADAMSMTIAGVLPTLTAPLATNVAALSAKENMFRGKLGTAESAYQNADDSGQQSIGQFASMLGQVGQQAGQLGQSAAAPAQALSGQTGMFGSLMQQAMQGAQGGAGGGQSSGGQSSGGQAAAGAAGVAGQGPATAGGQPQPAREDAVGTHEQQPQEPQHDEREALQRAETDDRARPSEAGDGRPGAGPAPVAPLERGRDVGEDDLSRRM
jgi:hypothetical protein